MPVAGVSPKAFVVGWRASSATTPSSEQQQVSRVTVTHLAMDAPPHLLSLKVMRVSVRVFYCHLFFLIVFVNRGQSWQAHGNHSTRVHHRFQYVAMCIITLFKSDIYQAHSTASILSLQGTTPLPGYPKTLRDLTHTTQFLTLPSSFGFIQLGETFSCCLCINNEAQVDIDGFSVKVEMQTASSKVVLADLGGPAHQIAVGDTFESIVTYEIKELGQHVLACTVAYKLPLNLPLPLVPPENSDDMGLQTFRKFYKFAVNVLVNIMCIR